MMKNNEVIVIGGGIGGLTAASLLSKTGYDVTLLEASREWGGCAGKFHRGLYTFPVGATLGMGFETNGIHDRILRYLQIKIDTTPLDEIMKIIGPEKKLMYFQDREKHVSQLATAFSEYNKEIHSFYQEVFQLANEIKKLMKPLPALPPASLSEWLLLGKSISPSSLKLLPLFTKTMKDLLEKHQLQHARSFVAFLDGQLIDSMQTTTKDCSLLLGCLALDIYHEGAFYIKGGLYKVAEALASSVIANGGQAKLGRKVVTLEQTKQGWLVKDQRKQQYEAKHIVFNGHLRQLEQLLDPKTYQQLPTVKKRLHTRQWGTFTLYLAVKEDVLSNDLPLFHQVLLSEQDELKDGNHLFISISAPNDLDRAPRGFRTITVSTHLDLQGWESTHNYDEAKQQMIEKMMTGVKKVFPHIEEGLIHLIPGSPRAWERFTHRDRGEVGGFPQTNELSLFRSLSHRTPLQGLWLCGDHVFPGAGTVGASVSGYHVFRSISGVHLP